VTCWVGPVKDGRFSIDSRGRGDDEKLAVPFIFSAPKAGILPVAALYKEGAELGAGDSPLRYM
jgi:hypothetical protein